MTRRDRVLKVWAPAAVALATLAVLAVVVPLLLGPAGAEETHSAPAHGAATVASDEQPVLPQPEPEAVAPLVPPLPAPAPTAARAGPHAISGQVLRAADGTPLAGAVVRALAGDDGPAAETDADGRFELPAAAADRIEVRYRVDRSWPHLPQTFALSGDSANALRLVYDSGFTLAGTVRDEQDHPLPRAQVGVLVSGSKLWSTLWVTADEEGRYGVPDLSPPTELGAISVTAQAAGHCPTGATMPVVGTAPGIRTLDLRLQREGAIEVTVRDAHGGPPVDLTAIVRTDSDQLFGGESVRHGTVRVGRLPAGRHSVFVLPTTGPDFLAPARIEGVVVEPGQITPLEVVLQTGAGVSGRVTDETGLPLAGAQVWFELSEPDAELTASEASPRRRADLAAARLRLRNAGARGPRPTGADGQFELHGVPAGHVRILAQAGGRVQASTELDLVPDETRERVDFELRPGVALRGNVRLADGSPMQFCTKVFVFPADPASDELLAVSETALEGAFVAEGLEPGPKRLLVVGADGSWVAARVEPGGEPQTFVAAR